MKKLLSVLLILSMLTACLLVMSSCGKVSERDLENDPYAVVDEAMDKSMNEFFSDEAGLGAVVKKASDKGKYTISFAGDDILGGELTKIVETVYFDKKNNAFVSDTEIVYNGETLSALIYGQKDKLALESNTLFGSSTALLFDLKTFSEKFGNSDLAELLGVDEDDIKEVKEMLNTLLGDEAFDTEANQEKIEKLCNELYAMMDQTVSTEKIKDADGNEIKCLVSRYTITNENLKKILKRVFDFAMEEMGDITFPDGNRDMSEIREEFDEMIAELDEKIDVDLKMSIYINSKSGALYKMTIDGDVTEKDAFDADVAANNCKINSEILFTDTEISFTASIEMGEETVSTDLSIKKEVDGKNVKYELSAKVGSGSVEMNLINATYEYKEDGSITVDMKLPKELAAQGVPSRITLNGKVEVEKKSAEISFNSLMLDGESFDFDLSIKIEAVDNIPKIPSDAKDIVDITEDEWAEIFEGIENGPLADIFGSSDMPEDDIYSSEEYSSGYYEGYNAGVAAGLSDAQSGIYTDFDIGDAYCIDPYYTGYVDGYFEGYEEGYSDLAGDY